jgi:hypothetical protein
LFALEGLAFWETLSPSNYHRFALPLTTANAKLTWRITGETLKLSVATKLAATF